MATKKQIAANRRNARMSTGPRTPAGIAVTRLNALTTGLHSRGNTMPRKSWRALLEIRDVFIECFQPQTIEQYRLVAQVACAEWKLIRWREVYTLLLRKAEKEDGPRRLARLRADFEQRQARFEQDLRARYDALLKSTPPPKRLPAA